MVETHNESGSNPINQQPLSKPQEVVKDASSHKVPPPDIQPSGPAAPSKSPVSTPSAVKTSPESQSSIAKVQPPSSQSKPPGITVHADSQQSALSEKIPAVNQKLGIYQILVRRFKTFVDSPLAYNTFLVILGVVIMLAGTFIVFAALLPKIYTCPNGATCRHNFDPKGDIIPRLQTLMQYWLQAGVYVSGLGLSNFIASESWYVMRKNGKTTMRTLVREVRAVEGGWSDALALVLGPSVLNKARRLFRISDKNTGGNTWLGLLALIQIAIGLFISFIIGFSITDLQGVRNVHVPFTYRSQFAIPRQDIRFTSLGEYVVLSQLNNWLLPTDGSRRPISVFDGTLVARDNRTIFATNPQPSGHRVTGNIACSRQDWNISVMASDDPYLADDHAALPPGAKAYNITNGDFSFATFSYVPLSSIFISRPVLSGSVTSRQYLWASNAPNIVPNATASSDKGMFYAVCNHTTRFIDLPPIVGDAQDIHPSQPMIYTNTGPDDPFLNPCPSEDPIACLSRFIDEVVLGFWQASVVRLDMVPFSCVTDVLVGYGNLSDTPNCALDDFRWSTTLSTAMDALIYTSAKSENATETQSLWAATDSINTDRWWIQTILPGVTLLLFLTCLVHTYFFNRGLTPFIRDLDISEVVYESEIVRTEEKEVEITDYHFDGPQQ